jgi:hypothetical protein
MVAVQRQPDLLEIVGALSACRGFPHLLDGRQQQADQDGNNGDDDEQVDQREGEARGSCAHGVALLSEKDCEAHSERRRRPEHAGTTEAELPQRKEAPVWMPY